jgi:glutamate-1-semialdehyde 2,1-aminomutase
VDRAKGSRVWTIEGRELIDYVCGYGSVLLGYGARAITERQIQTLERGIAYNATNPFEVEAADRLVTLFPAYDQVRLCTTGSEATTAAIGLARAATGRDSIAMFRHHYHGWHGPTIGARTAIPGWVAATSPATQIFELPYNDVQTCEEFFSEQGLKLACVILEIVIPVDGRAPDPSFVQLLHRARDHYGFLLIADEVVTGFRLGLCGAQRRYSVVPDVTVFGKALGGGVPIGAIIGRREHMSLFAAGRAVHAGTFNGNALAAASACAMLSHLTGHEHEVYPHLYQQGTRLIAGLQAAAADAGANCVARGPGPFFWFGPHQAGPEQARWLVRFYDRLLAGGVRIPQGGRWFLGTSHSDDDVEATIMAAEVALRQMEQAGEHIRG